MLYLYSKDFIAESSREVLLYDSSLYNPPSTLDPSSKTAALAVLRKARAVLGNEGRLNVIAGVRSGIRYLTTLRWGITQDVFDLVDLCVRDRSNDPLSPVASASIQSLSVYNNGDINTVVLVAQPSTTSLGSGPDYYFTNPTFSGSLTLTFTYCVQQANSLIQDNQKSTIIYGVSPLGPSGRYSGFSALSFSSDPCAFAYGRRQPSSSRPETVFSKMLTSSFDVTQPTTDASETVNLDCFLIYDPVLARFKRYGASNIAYVDSKQPGTRPKITLYSRSDHVSIAL